MPAPKGNQFWNNRSKHGREEIFTTPELLWSAACDYFTWCDSNPWLKHEAIKSGEMVGKTMTVPTQRPYTIKGFCLFINASEAYWRQYTPRHIDDDFSTIIKQIEDTIATQQFEGAAVGAFNANIIARTLGLTDKSEIEHSGEIKTLRVGFAKDE